MLKLRDTLKAKGALRAAAKKEADDAIASEISSLRAQLEQKDLEMQKHLQQKGLADAAAAAAAGGGGAATLERFATDVCGLPTMTPEFHYEHVHYIPKVTQAFLDFISGDGNGMDFDVYASPTYTLPQNKISTTNTVVAAAFGASVVKSGVELDLDKANFWITRAVGKGHEGAIEELALLREKERLLRTVVPRFAVGDRVEISLAPWPHEDGHGWAAGEVVALWWHTRRAHDADHFDNFYAPYQVRLDDDDGDLMFVPEDTILRIRCPVSRP